MRSYDNTFVRGPSPTYSDEATTSENAMSATLSMGMIEPAACISDKCNSVFEFKSAASSNDQLSLKKGRHTFAFWAVISILLVMAVGNLILTLTIISVLHLGKGIQGMELIPEEDTIKFTGITDLDRIYSKVVGQLDSFADEPMTITGDDGAVLLRLYRNGQIHNRLSVDKSGIHFRAINSFEIKDPEDDRMIFSTHKPSFNMPNGTDALYAKFISASKIASPIDQALKLESDDKLSVRGSEGIYLDGARSLLHAENNIIINSTNGYTILEAGSGIYFDMDKIPKVSSEFGLRTGSVQYKLCVCMPQGTVYRIAIPRVHTAPKISCTHFNPNSDPCASN